MDYPHPDLTYHFPLHGRISQVAQIGYTSRNVIGMTSSPGMSSVTPKSFLGLLDQSGLVDREVLRASLAELSHKAAGRTLTLEDLCAHLIEAGLITAWHAGKLKSGKFKGFFLGKYKLLGLLGSGGMSTVYLAQHTIFEQRRAIKVLPRNRLASKTYLERFYREGRAAASLNHRNIVRVYDIGQEGDVHYLVMEFVEGQDIYSRVKETGPLSFVEAVDFTIQALTGLNHAHENGLVHRDVKPANLLVTPDGTVKVLDLGLALFREEDSSLTVIHNEKVLGTADYLSPEQAVDSHNVDRRADIYSTGCSLYYMLTGRPPFPDGTLAQRIARHQSIAPESVGKLRPETPRELVAIIEKMMEKKPENRFPDCKSAIEALRSVLESLTDSAATSLNTQTTPPKRTSDEKKVTEEVKRQEPGDKKAKPTGSTPAGNKPAATRQQVGTTAAAPKSKPAPASPAPAAAKKSVSGKPSAAPASPKIDIVASSNVPKIEISPAESELKSFVAAAGKNLRNTVKPQRPSARNQWILAAIVAGMLLLLGLTILVAMWLTSAGDEGEKEEDTSASRAGEVFFLASQPFNKVIATLMPSVDERGSAS